MCDSFFKEILYRVQFVCYNKPITKTGMGLTNPQDTRLSLRAEKVGASVGGDENISLVVQRYSTT